MNDEKKTKAQLADELASLRQRITALEASETELNRAKQALKEAKDKAESLINSSLDMIISTDINRNIVEFNQAAENTFGYTKAEVVGKPIDILYADASEATRIHTNLLFFGKSAGEIRNRRKNGETFFAPVSDPPPGPPLRHNRRRTTHSDALAGGARPGGRFISW